MYTTFLTAVNGLVNLIVDIWLWITVGLIGIIAFFGRRLIKKWDSVVDSHMPDKDIEMKFKSIASEMAACERKIVSDQSVLFVRMKTENDFERKALLKSVEKVHERIDELYQLLLQKG